MKNIRSAVMGLLGICAIVSDAYAVAGGGWRWVGVNVGETNGVMFRQRDEVGAIEAGAGWSILGEDAVQVHCAVHLELYDERPIQLYVGYGARVKLEDNVRYGLRFPLGVNYQFSSGHHQWQAFLEAAPLLDVSPHTTGHVSVTAGIRVGIK